MSAEWPLLGLFGLALLLLGGVTVGVGYLTWVEWRDRRRRQEQTRSLRSRRQ
ncbi:MAG: hypothetical protein RMI89_01760 [Gloeomargarita sp. SKYBB_i_bin120]|nr:hypothetical protein [Gloeomargarita sp. SKYG98]MCS7291689.1 hypothetical protein [Gloeomargarita sp. SKYB120]MDW8177248.1 hypothetical protein [Gloeomargarita sp. SKYBB_i_bin120]